MKPLLFSVGNVYVFSFGALVAVGVGVALFLALLRARRNGFPKTVDVYDLTFIFIIMGLLGSRLYYVMQYTDWYFKHPEKILVFWEGGLTFYGGVIGAFLGGVAYAKLKHLSVVKTGDFLMPFIALFHAFSRIGCFLNGCCSGRVCHLDPPWCLKFPETVNAVYPTQLFEAVFNFFLFLFLYFYYERKRFDGQIMALYFMIYAVGRFVIEFWRDNQGWFYLSHNQWFSVGLFLISLFFYCRWKKASSQIPSHVKSGNRRSGQ